LPGGLPVRNFMVRYFAFVALMVCASLPAAGQSSSPAQVTVRFPLANRDIVQMVKAQFADSTIIKVIETNNTNFDLSVTGLVALKNDGVSQAVIEEMLSAGADKKETKTAAAAPSQPQPPTTDPPAGPPPVASNNDGSKAPAVTPDDGKTRVFVTDSESWETRGGSSASGNRNGWSSGSWMAGGARPQTAEIIKTLNQRCPELTVTNNLGRANFVLTLDHEGGKGALEHRNKLAVFNQDGDDIFSVSTRELGNSVKDACQAMLNSKK
jgi:hypothetical protein